MIGSISSINPSGNLPNKDAHSLISNDEIKNIIIQLETDIADNSWYHKDYSAIDMDIMPALVTQANNKYPEMNLNFVKSPWDIFCRNKKSNKM
nr:YopJ family acetyltransferase [Morganella morganii]